MQSPELGKAATAQILAFPSIDPYLLRIYTYLHDLGLPWRRLNHRTSASIAD